MKLHWSQTLKNGQHYMKNNPVRNSTRYSYNLTDINPLSMGHQTIHGNGFNTKENSKHQYLKKSRILGDMHDNKVEPHSFITVVIIASIFLFSTMTITASLAVFCRKKNSVFVLQKCEQEDKEDIEMDEVDTDTETDSGSEVNYQKRITKSNSDYVLVISPSKKSSDTFIKETNSCQQCNTTINMDSINSGIKSSLSDTNSNYCSIVNGKIVESNKNKYDEITQLLNRCEMLNHCDGMVIDTFTHMQSNECNSFHEQEEVKYSTNLSKKRKFKFKSKSNTDIVLENKHAQISQKNGKVQNSEYKEEQIYILKNSSSDYNEFLKKSQHIVLLKFSDTNLLNTINIDNSSDLNKPLMSESHTVDQATSPIVSLNSNEIIESALETTKLLSSIENTSSDT